MKSDTFAKLYLLLIITLLFTNCGKNSRTAKKNKQPNVALLQHAKQQDVPVPVGFIPTVVFTESKQIALCYNGNLSVEQSVSFYKEQMEVDGWRIQDFSENTKNTQEGLLFCNKAKKCCAITIRKDNPRESASKTTIRVMIQTPQHAHYAQTNLANQAQHDTTYLDTEYQDTINRKKITLS